MQNKIVVIVGPTACGKTALSVELAKCFGGEIISADSMQIYRGMDIGTAKIRPEEMRGVPHYMIDIIEPSQEFCLADFLSLARKKADDILSRGKIPFLVGGTGLYVSSFIDNVHLTEESPDPEYREYLNSVASEKGGAAVKEMLKDIDPESYEKLDENNIKRIVRALEVYKATGRTIGENNRMSKSASPYEFCEIGLNFADRQKLYDRIDARVDKMFEDGLLHEVERLSLDTLSATARQAIGYKQFLGYLSGDKTLDEVKEDIKRESRRYAKRQITWFKRDNNIVWFNSDETGFDEMVKICKENITNFAKK